MLEFDNVCFQYDVDDYAIMDKLSFQIQDGEFVCVIGPSGCGKSTIFRLVNKLLTPDAGRVLVNGQQIESLKNYCGYMPQHDLLISMAHGKGKRDAAYGNPGWIYQS